MNKLIETFIATSANENEMRTVMDREHIDEDTQRDIICEVLEAQESIENFCQNQRAGLLDADLGGCAA